MPPNTTSADAAAAAGATSSMPNPQNPTSTAWHLAHAHHASHMPHIHIPTPHPVAATAQFLDKHVPVFAKHHTEFSVNKAARAAKREARHSLVDSPIPEYESDHDQQQHRVSTALRTAAVTTFAPALADGEGLVGSGQVDANEAWMAVLAKREAARLRSGVVGGSDGGSSGSSSDFGARRYPAAAAPQDEQSDDGISGS
ncbi:hypothetical protein PV08_10227 [Exophiala spinifera]|uniref:Uncharacterized protein n=1 Tax=Exophiala spinifera TaxID=91928 RepID=A0A0D2AW23_9EURO|nr:uncharacterized protein PV08_10227 [Exophiala spinifera]KIW10928.1 hypothetical protein PV08_10227 [Exophiala spinifera]